MPHLGYVVIEDGVHIHNNVCVDRGVIGSTIIGAGTCIDNLVHVAHSVKIGKNCLIVAGAVIGGSTEIGDNCFIGINASIKNKLKIGKNVTIGMGAVITKDVPDGATVVGLNKIL
jgi:UDP-3-O-[3-hydroxymyristoyl] glucosamine N-acyltransferase